jgi:hypothetical protein
MQAVSSRSFDIRPPSPFARRHHSPAVTEVAICECQIDDVFVRGLEVNENDPQVLAPRLI